MDADIIFSKAPVTRSASRGILMVWKASIPMAIRWLFAFNEGVQNIVLLRPENTEAMQAFFCVS